MAIAVIPAEPDAYDVGTGVLMGRHSAGRGFLRAAVAARGENPIFGRTPARSSADRFRQILAEIDPTAPFQWVLPDRLDTLAQVGVLYTADPTLAKFARMRLRTGLASFSICGVTHTTASPGTMDHIVDLVREPTAPWDALICTSTSVVETIRRVHEAEAEYLAWRFGVQSRPHGPQLPIIPLGVHCDDFVFSPQQRADARRELGLADDQIAGLFVGRLVFHAKAHPFPTFKAFQMAAERTGRRLAIIFSGWFPNRETEQAFRAGAASFAPDVTVIFLDGRAATTRDQAWAASDLFVSPSDNIQETFGLTPVEAMAAGLPVVVSDYDGYRDTVRQAVDGFRIRTWAPGPGGGESLARALEAEQFNYNHYCWGAASVTAVEVGAFADAVTALVERPELRKSMGKAGRQRAREVYDWSAIFRQYQELWNELNARRRAALADAEIGAWLRGAPRVAPSRQDPFVTFGHYPTATLTGRTTLSLAAASSPGDLKAALDHPLFGSLIVGRDAVEYIFDHVAIGETTISAVAVSTGYSEANVTRVAGLLLKMGLVDAAG